MFVYANSTTLKKTIRIFPADNQLTNLKGLIESYRGLYKEELKKLKKPKVSEKANQEKAN